MRPFFVNFIFDAYDSIKNNRSAETHTTSILVTLEATRDMVTHFTNAPSPACHAPVTSLNIKQTV